jgi:hypothetical protein
MPSNRSSYALTARLNHLTNMRPRQERVGLKNRLLLIALATVRFLLFSPNWPIEIPDKPRGFALPLARWRAHLPLRPNLLAGACGGSGHCRAARGLRRVGPRIRLRAH